MSQLAKPVKGTSWTDLIVSIRKGCKKPFPLDKQSTIRPLISGRVALMYPNRRFETSKGIVDDKEVLIVKRVA